MTELENWNARLENHFAQLRSVRQSAARAWPIFALEHGLTADERNALASALRAHVLRDAPSRHHALAWIVYAAELGYRYSGDEYWQTFEEETPGWVLHGDRSWLRDRFRWFSKTYGGAEPSGAWASQFTIICWPIRHAILPRDLQVQLARILYELRDSFSAELFESPSRLGELVAARSWNASSRFRNLAQEPLLVGQIATALLLQGQVGANSLIQASALQRIGEDLERERMARVWLRGARRSAQERARVRGLAPGRGPATSAIRRPEEARAELAALGIEPRMVLRPLDAALDSWEASLEIPELSHLLFRFPSSRDALTGSRCIVAGSSGRPLARGRLLHGSQRVTLIQWPRTDDVLLRFDPADAQLDYLLRTECLLRPGPSWLFRIASDGLAYESRALRVRPGERYVLITTREPPAGGPLVRRVNLACKGVHGSLLALPPALTTDWERTLERLGLARARTIEVWPAGLASVVWDGEGRGEWLASERPCLAIRTDHPTAGLFVTLDSVPGAPLELTDLTPGEPAFIELPQLPVGLHTVRLATRRSLADEPEALGELAVVMRVREARPWSSGVSAHGPLILQLDPLAPTLEELWEGRAELSMQGPAGRSVKCKATLLDSQVGGAPFERQLPPIQLPMSPSDWRTHFERHFQGQAPAHAAYDRASLCQLEFAAEELGTTVIRCEREFTPLRWALRRDGQAHVLRLLDDSGEPVAPEVVRSTFETPALYERLESAALYPVPSTGGLYVASRGEVTAAVVVPPAVRQLADLRCVPRIDGRERSPDSLLRLVASAGVWARAKQSGDLFASIRRRDVLRALVRHTFGLIGGDAWAAAEVAATSQSDGLARLQAAVSRHAGEAAIGAALADDLVPLASATCAARVGRLALLASRVQALPSAVSSGPTASTPLAWLAELALRLASSPADVEEWAGARLREGLSRLLEAPTLARAARFLVLATDRHLQSRAAPDELYASWSWE